MPSTPIDKQPEPELGTELIPKERYTSSTFAEREWEGMWKKVWLLAGRESDLVEPGDYFTFEIGTDSILVVRQPDGSLAARHNVCMHRGNRLREPGRGHADRFSCIYHGWQYDLDGSLLQATDPHTFPQGVSKDRLSLRPVLCDTWAGFVFISLNPEAGPLLDYLGILPEHLEPYHFENWKVEADVSIEVPCNWKTSVDAFNEAYHVHATHAWTLEFTDDVNTVYDCYERHTRMIFPEVIASPRHPGHGTVTPGIKNDFLKRVGIDVEGFVGGPEDARSAFAGAIRKMGPALGANFDHLTESQMCDDYHYTMFPNITFNIHSMFVWVFWHRPHPTDPNKMYFDFMSLMNTPSQDVPRPERSFYRVEDGDTLAHLSGGDVVDEDMYNLPRVQLGMNSSAFEGLHLSTQEVRIRHFHDTLMGYLEGRRG